VTLIFELIHHHLLKFVSKLINYFFFKNKIYFKSYSHLPNTIEIKEDNLNEISKLIFRDSNENETFTIQKKYFQIHDSLTKNVYNDSGIVSI
jgi:hypothetical protein